MPRINEINYKLTLDLLAAGKPHGSLGGLEIFVAPKDISNKSTR